MRTLGDGPYQYKHLTTRPLTRWVLGGGWLVIPIMTRWRWVILLKGIRYTDGIYRYPTTPYSFYLSLSTVESHLGDLALCMHRFDITIATRAR